MSGDDDVVKLMVFDEMIAGMHQLHPRDDRQAAADHPGDDREEQVKSTNVLVIGGAKPAGEKARRVAVAVHVMAM